MLFFLLITFSIQLLIGQNKRKEVGSIKRAEINNNRDNHLWSPSKSFAHSFIIFIVVLDSGIACLSTIISIFIATPRRSTKLENYGNILCMKVKG